MPTEVDIRFKSLKHFISANDALTRDPSSTKTNQTRNKFKTRLGFSNNKFKEHGQVPFKTRVSNIIFLLIEQIDALERVEQKYYFRTE